MTSEFEQRVQSALTNFLATVAVAAERAATEALRAAFAQASLQFCCASTAVDDPLAELHKPSPRPKTHELENRVIDSLRAHPGASATELEPHVGIQAAALRRYLTKMAKTGLIRVVEAPSARGPARRTYFITDTPPHGAAASGHLAGAVA
jgi:hypothetical protein